jgi:hypothetical protein
VDATSKGAEKRLRQDRLEHNTTHFSHGRRVLCSGGLNHVNPSVPRVHLELTTKRLKAFPVKESHRAALERLRWKCHKRHSGQTSSVSVHDGGSLRVPGSKDAILQWHPQDPGRP